MTQYNCDCHRCTQKYCRIDGDEVHYWCRPAVDRQSNLIVDGSSAEDYAISCPLYTLDPIIPTIYPHALPLYGGGDKIPYQAPKPGEYVGTVGRELIFREITERVGQMIIIDCSTQSHKWYQAARVEKISDSPDGKRLVLYTGKRQRGSIAERYLRRDAMHRTKIYLPYHEPENWKEPEPALYEPHQITFFDILED